LEKKAGPHAGQKDQGKVRKGRGRGKGGVAETGRGTRGPRFGKKGLRDVAVKF